ncbi:MAG: argininosuccinate lyase [Spirochaetales bacterium]|nr:argininosuccinate lyase [Spirochaetales bacterium]
MAKLWQKDYDLNTLIERFTVGEDYLLDKNLIAADCVGSIAHAAMLSSINIISNDEYSALKNELLNIIEDNRKKSFTITVSDEDCHTAIENRLVEKLGDAGKKIHTGRSRNDQIIAAVRLYTRDLLLELIARTFNLVEACIAFAEKNKNVPMPGRTHMQIAMPSSVGLWAGAFAEELIDDLSLVFAAYRLNDMCPLGSAASYGVPIPLNREMVSDSLGFEKLQNNVLYVNNTRGKIESIVLDSVEQIVLSLSKMAQDLILFSMPEFRYFVIPAELCSGSSIMPQKKNPCGLELIRAKSATVSASVLQIKGIIKALPSGYNRDFQETKGAFLRGMHTALDCIRVMTLTVTKLGVNEEKLKAGFIPEIYATDRALELVAQGMPFRDAYKEVGLNLDTLSSMDPVEALQAKTHTGATGNLGLDCARKQLEALKLDFVQKQKRIEDGFTSLMGFRPALFSIDE